MNNIMNKLEDYTKGVRELKKKLLALSMNEDSIKQMRSSEFELMQETLKMIDTSIELTSGQIKMLVSIDEKLDKLLEKNKKNES